jgi:hypothetical protein
MFKCQRFPLTLLLLILVIIGCSKSTKYQDYEIPSWAHEEAELISLCLSGELEAPKRLSKRVLNELATIRSTFGDEFEPITRLVFTPPWLVSCLIVGFDSNSAEQVARGEYRAWDNLNRRFHVSRIDTHAIKFRAVTLYFEMVLHPRRLAEEYRSLPGVSYAEPNGLIGDFPNVYPRKTLGQLTYLFRHAQGDCPSGCIYSEYWYFVFSGSRPVFVGHWIPSKEPQPGWWDEAELNRALYFKF